MSGPGEIVRQLAEQIRELESSLRPCAPATIPFDPSGLGALFPEGGLSSGSLVELVSQTPGAGAWTLALLLARHACGESKTLVIADPDHSFYPPATQKLGIDPKRTITLRLRTAVEALSATAQALRCPAIGTAIGPFDRLTDREGRRLQLAAESGGSVGVLLRPRSALTSSSFASVRWLLSPLPSRRGGRRIRVEVVRCRGGQEGKVINVEIDDVTSHVRVFSRLERAADSRGADRATG